jgi:hypothetical protein
LIVPEADLLLMGAGTRLLAYALDDAEHLWEDEADAGGSGGGTATSF